MLPGGLFPSFFLHLRGLRVGIGFCSPGDDGDDDDDDEIPLETVFHFLSKYFLLPKCHVTRNECFSQVPLAQ